MPWNVRIRGSTIPLTAVLGGDRHVRRLVRRRRAAPRGAHDRHPVDARRPRRLPRLPPAPGPRRAHHRTRSSGPQRPADFRGARLPHRARADLRRRRQRASALRNAAKLIGAEGVVYAVFVLPCPTSSRSTRGSSTRRRTGARCSRARASRHAALSIKIHTGLIRTRHPGATLVEEAQRIGADVIYLVDDPRAGRRAAASGRPPPTCSASARAA